MARKYFPELGDVVCYKGNRMVIVAIESNCIAYPVYHYYLLEECLIKDISFIETDKLMEKSVVDMWVPKNSEDEPHFTKIDTKPYTIKQINFTKIEE